MPAKKQQPPKKQPKPPLKKSAQSAAKKAASAFKNKPPAPQAVCPLAAQNAPLMRAMSTPAQMLQPAAPGSLLPHGGGGVPAVGTPPPAPAAKPPVPPAKPPAPPAALTKTDKINAARIAELDPAIRGRAEDFLAKSKAAGYDLRITQGLRTFEQQEELYKQGRTKPGQIVTWARGGQSLHNFGLAFDVFDEKKGYDLDWNKVGQLGKDAGLEWGGDWKGKPDRPHFQYMGGLTLEEIQKGKRPK
ncbi:MAG TPA: M15 family metallopeptidase [Pyrinomonadaceae bacterium]|nr:M15 family metallopeptidase [Pyrinomonadaceae bacterium]